MSWCFQLLSGTGHVDSWTVSLPVIRNEQRLISAERINSRAPEISQGGRDNSPQCWSKWAARQEQIQVFSNDTLYFLLVKDTDYVIYTVLFTVFYF